MRGRIFGQHSAVYPLYSSVRIHMKLRSTSSNLTPRMAHSILKLLGINRSTFFLLDEYISPISTYFSYLSIVLTFVFCFFMSCSVWLYYQSSLSGKAYTNLWAHKLSRHRDMLSVKYSLFSSSVAVCDATFVPSFFHYGKNTTNTRGSQHKTVQGNARHEAGNACLRIGE